MGEVYLAEHRHLKRKAAVKLLAPEIVGRPDLLERFFLEARATSAIDHPGIVQVFDCEVDATGRPYIVMEYLDGETLAATLARRGSLPAGTVARLARGMAEALSVIIGWSEMAFIRPILTPGCFSFSRTCRLSAIRFQCKHAGCG